MLTALKSEVLRPTSAAGLVDSLAYYLCGELLRHHRQPAREWAALDLKGLDLRLQRAIDFMHAHIGEPVTLDMLAEVAHLSRFRFAHLFKKQYGVAPYAYLKQLRIQLAAERIRTTDESLTQIAMDLGFGSSSRLSEDFRNTHGMPPSRWRRTQK